MPDMEWPPHPVGSQGPSQIWCARQDLNLHALRHYHLKVARLPIPPRAHVAFGLLPQAKTADGTTWFATLRRSTGCDQMVGAVRFELTTSCTRNKRATRLRYAPNQTRAGKWGNAGHVATDFSQKVKTIGNTPREKPHGNRRKHPENKGGNRTRRPLQKRARRNRAPDEPAARGTPDHRIPQAPGAGAPAGHRLTPTVHPGIRISFK